MILTLDPGKETGWAKMGKKGKIYEVGSIGDSKEELWLFLCGLKLSEIDLVIMEELLAFGARMSGERYKVEGVIELWTELHKLELIPMHPSTVKKIITGAGNCKKADMRKALKGRVEIPGKSNVHIVDAVSVGLAYLVQHEGLLL